MKRLALLLICWLVAAPAEAQTALVQSPAYQECTTLAATNPAQALEKAEGWLKIDNGTAAQHCRAMALYGLRRFAEAGDALTATRDTVPPEHYSMRSYLAQQAARAWVSANRADQALAALSTQLAELATIRGDNVGIAKLTSELLLARAELHITYGKAPTRRSATVPLRGAGTLTLVVVADKSSHVAVRSAPIRYFPGSLADGSASEAFEDFVSASEAGPGGVTLADYDYANPTKPLSHNANVPDGGVSRVVEYGARSFTSDDVQRLAGIRAERLAVRQHLHRGMGAATRITTGTLFDLDQHPLGALNRSYLIVAATHRAWEPGALATWGDYLSV